MSITIVKGDIMEQPVDYIVNAANPHLAHGGGIARAIADAATYWPDIEERSTFDHSQFWYDERRKTIERFRREQADHSLIPTGSAGLTSAGVLPFKGVIHAVGPVWGDGSFYERELLRMAYGSAYAVLLSTIDGTTGEIPSIAFPSISTGIFGFPVEEAAEIALTEAHKWRGIETTFALFDDYTYEAFQDALDKLVTTQ